MNDTLPPMHPSIRDLILHGEKRSWISYEELNTALPDEMVNPDKIDQLLQLMKELGIECLNYEDPRLRRGIPFYAPLQTNLKIKRDSPFRTFGLANNQVEEQTGSDDDNEDGLPDVDWPLIQLQRIQTDDPSGGESSPPVTLPGVVMALDPESPSNGYSLLSEATEQGISLDEDGLLVTEEIRIYVPGLVVTSTEPLQLDPIEGIAAAGTEVLGQYRLVVINPDGRLWIVPNELGALGLPSQQVAVELIAAQ